MRTDKDVFTATRMAISQCVNRKDLRRHDMIYTLSFVNTIAWRYNPPMMRELDNIVTNYIRDSHCDLEELDKYLREFHYWLTTQLEKMKEGVTRYEPKTPT